MRQRFTLLLLAFALLPSPVLAQLAAAPVVAAASDLKFAVEEIAAQFHIDDPTRPPLFVSVPLHVAQRYGITSGKEIVVSFLVEGIHLMPPDKSLSAR